VCPSQRSEPNLHSLCAKLAQLMRQENMHFQSEIIIMILI